MVPRRLNLDLATAYQFPVWTDQIHGHYVINSYGTYTNTDCQFRQHHGDSVQEYFPRVESKHGEFLSVLFFPQIIADENIFDRYWLSFTHGPIPRQGWKGHLRSSAACSTWCWSRPFQAGRD